MNDTMVTLVGNAATAVEHRQTTAGVTVARFRLAATSRRWDKAQERWTDGGTSFYTVRSWRALADNVAASVAVGEPLVVQGRLRLREGEQPPERGGQRWFSAEVDAVAIGHDLARGTSAFRRVTRAARTEADPAPSPSPQTSARPPHETSGQYETSDRHETSEQREDSGQHETSDRHETSEQHETSRQHKTSEEHEGSEQHEAGEEMLPGGAAPALGRTVGKAPVKRRSRARTSMPREHPEPRGAPVTAASSATHSSQKAAVP
ncbi:single-stranded DNA-binding protein [Streptomyces decoyicus]|uniref:single-stranded DNA-binding protein n=1 Tax=Streptomyces decoyicus TaxID=249567 RepID=UPI003627702B